MRVETAPEVAVRTVVGVATASVRTMVGVEVAPEVGVRTMVGVETAPEVTVRVTVEGTDMAAPEVEYGPW